MSRRKPQPPPPVRPTSPLRDVPGEDLPSPEVLDELLKAFSADNLDTGTLRKVDFDSPEVEELLAPTAPTPGPDGSPGPVAAPDAESGVTSTSTDAAAPAPVVEDATTLADAAPVSADVPAVEDVPVAAASGSVAEATSIGEDDETVVGVVGAAGVAAPEVEVEVEVDAEAEADAEVEVDVEPEGAASRTVVIDASDDPPDAVYLAAGDPLLGAVPGGARHAAPPDAAPSDGTVFIDDDAIDDPGTISLADASSATRIEPRLRERRIAVKRAAGRKRLRWALLAAVIVAIVVGALAVLGSPLFSIEDVKVQGVVYADQAAVDAVVAELEGQPVLRVDTAAAERQLEAIPWVDSARVVADFPNSASIEIRERTPTITYLAPDGRYRVLDDEGRVLDVLDGQPVDQLLLVAADATDLEPGQFAPQGFIAAASLARSLTPDVRSLVEDITVTGDGSDLRLQLAGDIEVRFGPARDLVTKLVRLQVKLPELADGGVQYVDVSTDEVTVG